MWSRRRHRRPGILTDRSRPRRHGGGEPLRAAERQPEPTRSAPTIAGVTLRYSPLDNNHRALDAKMVPFGGWEMPLSYPGGTVAEHLACRRGAVAFASGALFGRLPVVLRAFVVWLLAVALPLDLVFMVGISMMK